MNMKKKGHRIYLLFRRRNPLKASYYFSLISWNERIHRVWTYCNFQNSKFQKEHTKAKILDCFMNLLQYNGFVKLYCSLLFILHSMRPFTLLKVQQRWTVRVRESLYKFIIAPGKNHKKCDKNNFIYILCI